MEVARIKTAPLRAHFAAGEFVYIEDLKEFGVVDSIERARGGGELDDDVCIVEMQSGAAKWATCHTCHMVPASRA